MTADNMWTLFKETGNIVFYLLYRKCLERENTAKTA